ncbi:hypothetical protein HDU76_013080 [Blyttiomyces sp. JEL0837]|nr:hypothetical protein HDU76_013080 [Blyttiomyces sp. JEL0837]
MDAQDKAAAKDKDKKKIRKRTRKPKEPQPRLKVVVRRLPPHLPENIFLDTVAQWTPETDWISYVQGKLAKSFPAKAHTFSRAYLNFTSIGGLAEFTKNYNGWLFKDEKNDVEYRAVVEFAPFQRIPKKKKKIDNRLNTLDADPDYMAFLESLKPDAEKKDKSTTPNIENPPVIPEKPKSTPLLDDLRAKKAAKTEQSQKAKESRKAAAAAAASSSSSPSRGENAAGSGKAAGSPKGKEKDRDRGEKKGKGGGSSGGDGDSKKGQESVEKSGDSTTRKVAVAAQTGKLKEQITKTLGGGGSSSSFGSSGGDNATKDDEPKVKKQRGGRSGRKEKGNACKDADDGEIVAAPVVTIDKRPGGGSGSAGGSRTNSNTNGNGNTDAKANDSGAPKTGTQVDEQVDRPSSSASERAAKGTGGNKNKKSSGEELKSRGSRGDLKGRPPRDDAAVDGGSGKGSGNAPGGSGSGSGGQKKPPRERKPKPSANGGANDSGSQTKEKEAYVPRVVIMKRDGTSSSFDASSS